MKISINKKTIISYLLLFCYILISGIFLIISDSVVLDIVALMILVFGAMSIVYFDLAHPYVWFSFIFMIYSISYPVLYLNGVTYDIYTYTKSLMFSQWLALIIFLITVSPSKVDYSNLVNFKERLISTKFIYVLISIMLILTVFDFSTGGYTHKSEIYSESAIASLGFRAALIFLIVYAVNLSITALDKNKLDIKQSIIAFILMFFLFYFSGERDYILRFFVITFFIYYVLIKQSKLSLKIVVLGIFALVSVPILAKYKYFGLTGEKTQSYSNFLINFLTSEFQSASKNLQIILLDENSNGLFNGSTFISAILRTFYLDKILGIERTSSIVWYNQTYFADGRAGQGFTLVGDGYVNFGYLGIITLFIFIGILLRFIYTRSNNGIYSFVFYILSIPIFMYAIRADLANILSPLIKQNLLTILILRILIEIIYDKKLKINFPHKQ